MVHRSGRDVPDVPGTSPQIIPGTLPRHTDHQFPLCVCVLFIGRFFSPRIGHQPISLLRHSGPHWGEQARRSRLSAGSRAYTASTIYLDSRSERREGDQGQELSTDGSDICSCSGTGEREEEHEAGRGEGVAFHLKIKKVCRKRGESGARGWDGVCGGGGVTKYVFSGGRSSHQESIQCGTGVWKCPWILLQTPGPAPFATKT